MRQRETRKCFCYFVTFGGGAAEASGIQKEEKEITIERGFLFTW